MNTSFDYGKINMSASILTLTDTMLDLKNIEEVYLFAASYISKYVKNSVVILNEVLSDDKLVKTKYIYGVGSNLIKNISKISGYNFINRNYTLTPSHQEFINSEKLIEFKGGLYEFSGNELSKKISSIIEKIIQINKIYTIGITKNKKAFASIHIFTLKKEEIFNFEFFELFVKQVGLVINLKKNQEENLNQIKLLEKLNHNKDIILYIIGHDLKNPLISISGLVDVLKKDAENKENEQIISLIKGSTKKASEILESLLNWAKSQQINKDVKIVKTDANISINEAIAFYKQISIQKKVEIINEVKDKTIVSADIIMLNSVFRNLISNALKYSYENGTIIISNKLEGNNVVISFKDFGMGIQENKINSIFEFSRNKSTLGSKNEKGTGLGLMLCKEFVEKMNGDIWAESIEGKETTFYVSIPSR